MSVLSENLKELQRVGFTELVLSPGRENKKVEGADNSVIFRESRQIGGGSPKKLAISTSKHTENKEFLKETTEIQKLLVERGVDMRFLLTYFMYSEDGVKGSLQASEGSLHHFIHDNKGQLTHDQVTEIFAQILMGVQALHEKNLAHRDLKPANILVTKNAHGELVAVVCDLDAVIPVHANGTLAAESFRAIGASIPAPELRPFLNREGTQWNITRNDQFVAYGSQDFRAHDIFALGKILDALMEAAEPGEFPDDDPLVLLRSLLTQKNPKTRCTVQSALDNYVDLPTQSRLRERESPYEYFGNYRARAFEPDNPFLGLKDHVKPVYELIEALDRKFNFFDELSLRGEKAPNLDLDVSKKSFDEFYTKISADINNPRFIEQKEVLKKIRMNATQKMAKIQLEHGNRIDDDLIYKLKQYNMLSSVYEEVGRAQLQQHNTISPLVLSGIVQCAYEEHRHYILSKSRVGKFFSHHGDKGMANADLLDIQVREKVRKGESTPDILSYIIKFLKDTTGFIQTPHSFKSIFEKHMKALDGRTLEQLQDFLSQQEVKPSAPRHSRSGSGQG